VKQLADGVWQLRGFPPNAINVYVLGDVMIDAGTKFAHRRILRQLRGHALSAHALTHAHPDHQGSTRRVCETLGIPLWCPEGDVEAMEDGEILRRMPDALATGIPGLHEPPRAFTSDPARNRESARRLAELEPALACFGHGPPLRDTRKLVDFVQRLPT
jgi:glyoxylase-like metal-dependent hydrolase (beta-lactamase superfamily II)